MFLEGKGSNIRKRLLREIMESLPVEVYKSRLNTCLSGVMEAWTADHRLGQIWLCELSRSIQILQLYGSVQIE